MERNFRVQHNAATKPAQRAEAFPQISNAVELVRVNRDTWTRALKEAGGDRRRIQILSENTVVIWNSVEQKAAMGGREDRYAINR